MCSLFTSYHQIVGAKPMSWTTNALQVLGLGAKTLQSFHPINQICQTVRFHYAVSSQCRHSATRTTAFDYVKSCTTVASPPPYPFKHFKPLAGLWASLLCS